jgi:hypothetical protein
LVILASVVLLSVMDRSDVSVQRQADRTGDLQRTRLVMQRVFSKLLMSEEPAPARRRTNGAQEATEEDGANKQPAPTRRGARDPNAPFPPPRLVLASPTSTGTGYVAASFQRLEVVVFDSPVPSSRPTGIDAWTRGHTATRGVRRSGSGAGKASGQASGDPKEARPAQDLEDAMEDAEAPVRAYRGAFEFASQPLRPGEETDPTAVPRYQLWWVPQLPRRAVDAVIDPAQEELARALLDPPTLLCSNIVAARWQLYDDLEKKQQAEVIWDRELPAYAEFEMQLASGVRVEWMFEVGWAKGPEVRKSEERADAAAEGKDGSEAKGGSGIGGGAGSSGKGGGEAIKGSAPKGQKQ